MCHHYRRPLAARAGNRVSPLIQPGETILFQGDSITDSGRKRTKPTSRESAIGVRQWLRVDDRVAIACKPIPRTNLRCFNRGISGNKVYQLAERWQTDCLDIKPNILSILIGVNDIWHKLNGNYDGTVEVYESDYQALMNHTKESLPDVKLVVCEPFVLSCGAVDDKWFPDFDDYRAAARRVADSAGAVFVPFQEMFDRAVDFAPPEYWAKDGVHPTPLWRGADGPRLARYGRR